MWNIVSMNPTIPGLLPLRRIASLFFLIFFASAAMFAQSTNASALATSPSLQIDSPPRSLRLCSLFPDTRWRVSSLGCFRTRRNR